MGVALLVAAALLGGYIIGYAVCLSRHDDDAEPR